MNRFPTNSNTDRIQRTSHLFIRLLKVLLVLVPLAVALIWTFLNDFMASMQHDLLPSYVRLPLPIKARLMAFGVCLIPLSLFVYATVILIRLFRLYQAGSIFGGENVRCFRRLSRVLMYWCVVGILMDPLMSVVLTLHHPPGERMLSLGVSSTDLSVLLIGGILAVIARVMDEGRKLQEEQALTI